MANMFFHKRSWTTYASQPVFLAHLELVVILYGPLKVPKAANVGITSGSKRVESGVLPKWFLNHWGT